MRSARRAAPGRPRDRAMDVGGNARPASVYNAAISRTVRMRIIRVLILLFAASIVASAQADTRRIYVTALDANGAPIDNLSPDDFVVKEGGKTHNVLKVQPAIAKMQIAILVDDNGTGLFRVPVARFMESLLGRAEFSVSVVTGQTMKLVDYTADPGPLSEAVAKLGARPGPIEGTLLLDGIHGTSLDMIKRKAARPVIVA